MSRGKLTDEERMAAVQEYFKGEGSYAAIAEKYKISAVRLQDLVCAAKEKGIDSIISQENNRKYSSELKEQAVKEYLSGKSSQYVICAKYGIKSRSILQKWGKRNYHEQRQKNHAGRTSRDRSILY